MHQKRCILMVENDDELCLPHCIALGIAHAQHQADPTDSNLCRNYHSMHKKDRRYVKLRDTSSLQKHTALKYQSMAGIQLNSPSLLEHILLYEKALGVGISVISAWGGNRRVYQCINALLEKSYYCSHCDMAFNNSMSHCCKVWCNICGCNMCGRSWIIRNHV